MTPEDVTAAIMDLYECVIPKASWGETAFFYNPGCQLPSGVYFCTVKTHDGENDKASRLDRPGVFRLSIGIGPKTYSALFGERPQRQSKGDMANTGYNYTELNTLMPHPVYAWMGWAQILNPEEGNWPMIRSHIDGAHKLASEKFAKRIAQPSNPGGRLRRR